MGKLVRTAKTFSGQLVGLAILLIVLFFLLNFIASKGWGPFSSVAAAVESRANGSAYTGGGTPAQVVGVPSSPGYGPAI